MKKIAWGGLFALVFMAGVITSFKPTRAETCCKQVCERSVDKKKNWHENHRNAEACCRKELCEKEHS